MTLALRASAVLWMIWGVVHVLAGVLTVSQATGPALSGIADGVDPTLLQNIVYPEAAGAVVNQHGFNLAWIGLTTMVGAVYIWRQSAVAIFVSALVGGLADVGYFVFIDLGGYNKFVPGTVMTIVSASAITLSFYVYFAHLKNTQD